MTCLLAEFTSTDQLLAAARGMRDGGYAELEAYTPFPIPALDPLLAAKRSAIPTLVAIAGVGGALAAILIQCWTYVVYPLRVGGFPALPWPAMVPIAFESTVLAGALTAFVAAVARPGLMRWWHPSDAVDGFERSSIDRFFLAVTVPGAAPAGGDGCRALLAGHAPLRVVTLEERP